MSRTIAIVEDDADQRENYSDALEAQGYIVQTFANKQQALNSFNQNLPDLAILDIMLEDDIDGGFRPVSRAASFEPSVTNYISNC